LFLERGRNLLGEERLAGQYAEMLAREQGRPLSEVLPWAGRWREPVRDLSGKKARSFVPFIGAGTGGSSGLYGAALERLFPEDFEPGRHHPRGQSSLPERWPLSYSEMRPWYRQAEVLYQVSGALDPLRAGDMDPLPSPPPLDEVNQVIAEHLAAKGLHPYRLPTACAEGERCQECQGFLCASRGKRNSATVCLLPALTEHGAALVSECEVIGLEAGQRQVTALQCRDASGEYRVHGEMVVLAAGALQTPLLLLRSVSRHWPRGLANGSGQVGRNLMRHAIDLYLVRPPLEVERYRKQLAYNDHYRTAEGKLGSVQSFGMLPPVPVVLDELAQDLAHAVPLAAPLFPLVRPFLAPAIRRKLASKAILAGILEDLPHAHNRVTPDRQGRPRLHYRLAEEDRRRLAAFRRRIAQDLAPWPVSRLSQADNNQRIAHVCGTCRFGDDPEQAVLDRNNRAHQLENLYVVDASFFPSSGGINPALTIAANALRVADTLLNPSGQEQSHEAQ
jgi:choline dehydrogenase-like flavoprotein